MIGLTEEMKQAIDNALMSGMPVIVAYVGDDGQPGLGYRGSTQVYSDDQLAIWARNPSGGIVKAAESGRTKLALLYRNPETRVAWLFHGRARVDDDPKVRERVYDGSPEVERGLDPERKGRALIIDIDRVVQRGQVLMER